MWPSVTSMMLAGWLCVLLAAVSADTTVYMKVGDTVVLKPGTISGRITNILWKDGPNIAIQWDGMEIDRYRHFAERGSLNTSNGEMTITGLTHSDSGLYTPEINTEVRSPIRLIVISPVPKPSVTTSCDDEKTSCTFTCDGDTADAAPVTYRWKSGDVNLGSSKQQSITKDKSSSVKEIICELENPVSKESSQPIPNPFMVTSNSNKEENEGKVNISTGVTVFICLLIPVLLLVGLHRCKTGMWFFQKTSMPWEADFWTKQERPRRDAAEANGTTAQEKIDEETPMTAK